MNILVVGDLHINCISTSDRHKITTSTLKWILDLVEELKPDAFVQLGDLGDDHSIISVFSLGLITDFIASISFVMKNKPTFWLVGNHDYASRDGCTNLLLSLSSFFPNNTHLAWPSYDSKEFQLISYLPSNDQFLNVRKSTNLLFTHHPIEGSRFSSSILDKDGVSTTSLPEYTIAGHYHKPFLRKNNNSSILYAGAPISYDFNDNILEADSQFQERRVWLISLNNSNRVETTQSIVNPYTDYYASMRCSTEEDFISHFSRIKIPLSKLRLRVFLPDILSSSSIINSKLSEVKYLRVYRSSKDDTKELSNPKIIKIDTKPIDAVKEYTAKVKLKNNLDRNILSMEGQKFLK